MTHIERAAGYIRVSTSGQATEDKLSLENQENKIRHYCRDEFRLVEPIYEDRISGAKDDRPGLQKLLAAARRKEFQHVVVNDLTRFGRSAKDLLTNTEELEQLGIHFHSVKDKIDCSTKHGKLFFTLLSAIAEFQLETIRVRMAEVKLAKWKAGKVLLGSAPYGYEFNEDRSAYIENDEESKIYKRMVEQYLKLEYNLDDIVISLQKDHILSRSGGYWFASTISDIFKNPIYTGYAVQNVTKKNKAGKVLGQKPEQDHVSVTAPHLITKTDWDELQAKIKKAKENKVGRPMRGADKFWLRDYITCGICGRKVVPQVMKKGELRYYACYWHSASTKKLASHPDMKKCSLPYIRAEWIEDFVSTWFNSQFEPHSFASAQEDKQFEKRIATLQERIRNLENDLAGKERALGIHVKMMENPKCDPEGI